MNAKTSSAKNTPVVLLVCLLATATCRAETVVGEPDAYLDYIEANGTQYIDTGVKAETGLKARMDMQIPSSGNNDKCLLGARHSDIRFLMIHSVETVAKPFVGYGNGDNRGWRPSSTFPTNRIDYVGDFSDGAAVQVYVNGTGLISSSSQDLLAGSTPRQDGEITTNDMNNITLYLFAANYDDAASWYSSARLYRLKIMKKNAAGGIDLLRNYIPCRKGNRAGLYDSINGTISFSDGSADFIGGEEQTVLPCEYVEWIESRIYAADGVTALNNYIDTGVDGKSGIKSVVDCSIRSGFSGDMAILACRAKGNGDPSRLFPAYFYSSYFGYGYKTGCWGHNGGANQVAVASDANARYLIESELSAGRQSVVVNGTELHKGEHDEDEFDTGTTLTLFGINTADGSGVVSRSNIRLYSAKIWEKGELMRDFVPCVDSSGQAGLWDRITYRMFKSSDAYDLATQVGAVTNGPAIPEGALPDCKIGYIESDGVNDYFDLEVTAKDGVEMETVMEWVTVPSDLAFVGARDGSGRNFALLQYNTSRAFYLGYVSNWGTSRPGDVRPATAGVKYHVITRLDGDGSQFISVTHRESNALVWDSADGGYSFAYPGPFSSSRSLYLFARNTDGTPTLHSKARVYRLKLREKQQNGSYALVRDLVPVKYDGKPMLYDKVSGRFFQKKGHGAYLATGGGEERDWQVGNVMMLR